MTNRSSHFALLVSFLLVSKAYANPLAIRVLPPTAPSSLLTRTHRRLAVFATVDHGGQPWSLFGPYSAFNSHQQMLANFRRLNPSGSIVITGIGEVHFNANGFIRGVSDTSGTWHDRASPEVVRLLQQNQIQFGNSNEIEQLLRLFPDTPRSAFQRLNGAHLFEPYNIRNADGSVDNLRHALGNSFQNPLYALGHLAEGDQAAFLQMSLLRDLRLCRTFTRRGITEGFLTSSFEHAGGTSLIAHEVHSLLTIMIRSRSPLSVSPASRFLNARRQQLFQRLLLNSRDPLDPSRFLNIPMR